MIEKHASGNSQKDYGEVDNTEETDLNNSKERKKKTFTKAELWNGANTCTR